MTFSIKLRNEKKINSVIIPVNICKEVYTAFVGNNFDVNFIDIDNELIPDKSQVENILKENQNQIFIFNHTYGNEFIPINDFIRLKNQFPNLIIIDDRCLCEPLFKNFKVSNYVDLTVFSTGSKKQCDIGYGGYGFLNKNHNELAKKWINDFEVESYIKKIESQKNRLRILKNQNIKLIESNLSGEIKILPKRFNNWRFNLLINNKDFVLKKLFDNNLFASNHYKVLDTENKDFKYKNATYLHSHIINLFIDEYTNQDMIKKSIEIINKYANT